MGRIIEVIERYEIPDIPNINLPDDDGEPLEPDENGRLWSSELEAWVGLWQGKYLETPDLWLRLFDEDGQLLPTTAEAAQAKAERLAAQLRALGVEPEE